MFKNYVLISIRCCWLPYFEVVDNSLDFRMICRPCRDLHKLLQTLNYYLPSANVEVCIKSEFIVKISSKVSANVFTFYRDFTLVL